MDGTDVDAERRRLGACEGIRVARGNWSMEEFAERCGVPVVRLSEWLQNGDVTLTEAHLIESAGGIPAGTIALMAGYVGEEALLAAAAGDGGEVYFDPGIASASFDRLDDAIAAVRGAEVMGILVRLDSQVVTASKGNEVPELSWSWNVQFFDGALDDRPGSEINPDGS